MYTLCSENCYDRENYIAAARLRERLPLTVRLLENMMRVHAYASQQQTSDALRKLHDFVAFCAAKEKETGRQAMITTLGY